MHGLYKLEETLCNELDAIGEKNDITNTSLEKVDKLSHALKNVQKVIEHFEEMGEEGGSYRSYGDMPYSYERRGGSYARKRDSRGRYSRDYSRAEDDMTMELRELMKTAPNSKVRKHIEELISEIEDA